MSQVSATTFKTHRATFADIQGLTPRADWDFPVVNARFDVAALVRELSEHLLHASTATAALHTWCAARSLGAGPITVVKQAPDRRCYPDDDMLDELRPERHERIAYRRVRLVRGPLVLSEADNWFVPERLPPEIGELLEETDVPFGTAIAQLQPSRRTYFVRFAELSAAWQASAADNSLVLSPAMTILEHRAVVLDRDRRPLSVVSERYRAALLGAVEAPFPSVH
jgi:chorismate-pyruvate lyase